MNRVRVGLIGVGLLGSALAERLLGRGFRIVGADVDPDRRARLRSLGGEVAADASEVVSACDRVLFSLPTSGVVASVVEEVNARLPCGLMIIDTTTGSPGETETLGRRLLERGVVYLDATVSGSSAQTRRGEAVLMVGGDSHAFEECRDLFDALARASFHVGPVGAGARMKLATNLVLGLNRAVLAEGLSFARSLGLDPGLALEVIRAGAASSLAADAKGPRMVSGDFRPEARLSQHLKDVRLILDEARRAGTPAPLSLAHLALLEAAELAGYGEADNSAVIRAYDVSDCRTGAEGEARA